MQAADIIEKYEVPKEYHDAIFETYAEGAKRGFIDASIKAFNSAQSESLAILKQGEDYECRQEINT